MPTTSSPHFTHPSQSTWDTMRGDTIMSHTHSTPCMGKYHERSLVIQKKSNHDGIQFIFPNKQRSTGTKSCCATKHYSNPQNFILNSLSKNPLLLLPIRQCQRWKNQPLFLSFSDGAEWISNTSKPDKMRRARGRQRWRETRHINTIQQTVNTSSPISSHKMSWCGTWLVLWWRALPRNIVSARKTLIPFRKH